MDLLYFGQILNNSSKYTPEGALIIKTNEDKQAYYITIKDNGIGISKEDLSRIFNKGFTGKMERLEQNLQEWVYIMLKNS